MKKEITIFILTGFILLLVILNTPIKAGSLEGNTAPKQVSNLAKLMKNKYMNNITKTLTINFAPKTDSFFEHNNSFCRSYNKQKIEKIGTLKCLPMGSLRYEKKGKNSKVYLVYGPSLYYMIRETGTGFPIAKYAYRINYPTANYDRAKVLMAGGDKISFDKNGKINAFLFKGQCYKENDKGEIVELMYAKNLCSDIIETRYYDDYKKLPVPVNY